jgi:hypothetical protein
VEIEKFSLTLFEKAGRYTLRCGLPGNMILQKDTNKIAKNNPKIFLLGHTKNLAL